MSSDGIVERHGMKIRHMDMSDNTKAEIVVTAPTGSEDQVRRWDRVEAGAVDREVVLSGKSDQILGLAGLPGDRLKRITAVVNTAANSQVIVKDGNPAALVTTATHASTASTTTVINTATITAALAADQYKDHILRVNGGAARRIVSHPSTAGNAVAAFTLDHALTAAPGTTVTITIEDPQYVYEALPAGMAPGSYMINIDEDAIGDGWRITTDTGVVVRANGRFE